MPVPANLANLLQHTLFLGVRLYVLPFSAKAIAEPSVPDSLAVAALVVHSVPSAFADRFAFPLANRRHDVQHQAAGGGASVQ
jgi:hypothetical protein